MGRTADDRLEARVLSPDKIINGIIEWARDYGAEPGDVEDIRKRLEGLSLEELIQESEGKITF